MMKSEDIKIITTIGIIIILLCLSCTPNVIADVSRTSIKNELVEITAGFNNGIHTKQQIKEFSKKDAKIIRELFDETKNRLNNVEEDDEAIMIFFEIVRSLDKFGLLPEGMTIEESQKFILRSYRPHTISNPLWWFFTRNLFCLVAGNASNIHFLTPYPSVKIISTIVQLGSVECGGYCIHHLPASGWVWSVGLLGIKHWDGDFYGAFLFPLNPLHIDGMIGFFGITLNYNNDYTYFIGSTLYLRIINWYE